MLEKGLSEHVEVLVAYFRTFENLHLTGRSSLFRYVHLHDLFRAGKELVFRLSGAHPGADGDATSQLPVDIESAQGDSVAPQQAARNGG